VWQRANKYFFERVNRSKKIIGRNQTIEPLRPLLLLGLGLGAFVSSFPYSRRRFDLAAASKLRLLYRSVPPPPAGFAGVGRGGEPDLWVEISIKVVFSKNSSSFGDEIFFPTSMVVL
jgi:hypothetical protein